MINQNIRQLLNYIKNHKIYLILVLFSLVTVSSALLFIGHIFKDLIDQGLANSNNIGIQESILSLCILIVIFSFGSFIRSYYISLVSEKVIAQIKTDAHNNLIKQKIIKFEELKMGDIISRLSSDAEQISTIITRFFSFLIRNMIMLSYISG